MAIRKIEPEEHDKMQTGYEYLKIVVDKEQNQSAFIYYSQAAHKEEIIDGTLLNLRQLQVEGWQHVYSNVEHYFERLTPEGEEAKREEERKAKEAYIAARTPPDDLKHFVPPRAHVDKRKPHINYAYVVWYRDKSRAEITYYNVEKTRSETRTTQQYGKIEEDLIRKGYYVMSRGGGREGTVGHFVKRRKVPKNLEP